MTDKPNSARERIIEATALLMEAQGYHGTGLNQIIAESGSPKGSLYHYFPEGKEALVSETLANKGRFVADRIREGLATSDDPAEAIRNMLLRMAAHVKSTSCISDHYHPFNSIAGVALETAHTSERLRQICQEIYSLWRSLTYDKLIAHGYSPDQAERLSITISAAIDGAIIQVRLQRNAIPLEHVAQALYTLVKAEGQQKL